jgi:tRNA threonylcarbamoyladenosine modification (KEOPS) complex Cgi121 subunit
MKTINFQINNHETRSLEILHSCININNIEKYLKRVGEVEKQEKIKIAFVPNINLYSLEHLLWTIYISENKFLDKTNISNNFSTEILLTLTCSNQIKKISNELYLQKKENKNIFTIILSNKKIEKNKLEKIKNKLSLKEQDEKIKFNTKEALVFYKVKSINQIIEKIAVSAI